jgi:hypothetical protein
MSVKQVKLKKSISTIEIELAVATYFGIRKHIIVPNLSWGFGIHEMDLAIITKNGLLKEIEIKISKSDLLADFKKGHNHIDRGNRITELYYALPNSLFNKCINIIPADAGIIVCERYTNYYGNEVVGAYIKREAKKIKNSRKLTTDEQLKIARLGCMRIWSLKQKVISLKKIKQ